MFLVSTWRFLLAFHPEHHVVEHVAIDLISQARFDRRRHIAVLIDANLVLEIRAVGKALWLRQLEPDIVRHGELAVKMYRVVQGGAPIVRLAHHVETLGHRSEERRVGKECRSRWS